MSRKSHLNSNTWWRDRLFKIKEITIQHCRYFFQ